MQAAPRPQGQKSVPDGKNLTPRRQHLFKDVADPGEDLRQIPAL